MSESLNEPDFDEYDDPFSEDRDPEDDEGWEDSCSGFFDGKVFGCMAVGSEDCDFDCPMSRYIGMTRKQIQRIESREIAKELSNEKPRENKGDTDEREA